MNIGVVDVGGGMRDIYGSGIFDWCLDNGVHFDSCVGVSAGSANLASYLAHQRGRNYVFYTEYTHRKQYMSMHNFLRHGSYIDMHYVYGTLSNHEGENPLDYATLQNDPAAFTIVACDARTGKPVYFTKDDIRQDDYSVFAASGSIPVVNRPYMVNGVPCFDGGIADPVPVNYALRHGCDKVVLVLTKPREDRRIPDKDLRPARLLSYRWPAAAVRLRNRYKTYNDAVDLAERYAAEGRVLILAPKDTCGVDTLTKDKACMDALYHLGYEDAKQIADFIK